MKIVSTWQGRLSPPSSTVRRVTEERANLLRYLQNQRGHILGALEGLDEETLRRPILPSGWTCLALVSHLTYDDERFWFRGVIARDQEVIDAVQRREPNGWKQDSDLPAEEVFARYRAEAALADAVLAECDLDAAPTWWPEYVFGTWRLDSVRQIVLHHITETATHAGHLDVVRELVDGTQWVVQD
ncbi:putative damage-inducible protein DinB [Catenulispora sp. GP43]